MKNYLIILCVAFCTLQCASTRIPELELQSFSRIPIDLEKLDKKDYSEIFNVLNNTYADGQEMFNEITVIKDNGPFLYLRVFSAADDHTCYRVTIDRHRSAIINMIPDCPQDS
ncbi:MAG TPA: hypothetical protein VKY57_12515 [Chitinispirillaceae bacterium]|nr:hypothetical protein [Chitinispirillaceae bacterium]